MKAADTGNLGENKVATYLKSKGFIIAARNFRTKFGEIDVIAENQTHIIFIEVKTRHEDYMVSGFESVDIYKQKRIKLAAEEFLQKIHINLQPRFDVAEVIIYKMPDNTDGYKLNYIKGAF